MKNHQSFAYVSNQKKSYFSYGSNQKDASGYQDAGKNRLEDGGTPMDHVFQENRVFDE